MTSPVVLGDTPTSSPVILGTSSETIDVKPITLPTPPIGYVVATPSGQTALGGVGQEDPSYVIGNASGSYAIDIEPSANVGVLSGTASGTLTIDTSSSDTVYPGLVVGLTSSGGGSGGGVSLTDGSVTKAKLAPDVLAPVSRSEGLATLPILKIDVTSGGVPQDTATYLPCTLTMDGQVFTSDIRGRGNSTWSYPKKPYKLKLTASQVMIPGVATSKKWNLLANYLDPAQLRNSIALEMGRRLTGLAWTPKYRSFEVFLNGVYEGVYQLTESVDFAATRVNASASNSGTGLPLTGAYLLEIDNAYHSAVHWVTTTHDNLAIIMDDPDGTDTGFGAAQLTYITNWLNNFETVLYGSGWLDPTTGYKGLVDVNSFIDWYLLQELVANNDSMFVTSCKCYKTRDVTGTPGKLFMGPLWDFDLCLGRSFGAAYSYTGWWIRGKTQPSGGAATAPGATWINRMIEDPAFVTQLQTRWAQLVTLYADIPAFIDKLGQQQAVARQRDSDVWRDQGHWRTEADYIKTWLANRTAWITDNIGGVVDTTPPTVPGSLSTTGITSTGFTLIWAQPSDNVAVTGYQVRLNGGTAIDVGVSGATGTYTFTGLTDATTYQIQVRARDAAGNFSAWSSNYPVTTGAGSTGTAPDPISIFDWHEGSGTETVSTVSASSLNAFNPSGAWAAGTAKDQFSGALAGGSSYSAWTIKFDFKIDAAGIGMTPFAHESSPIVWINLNAGKLALYDGAESIASTALTTDVWYEVMLCGSVGAKAKLYVDGQLAVTSNSSVAVSFDDSISSKVIHGSYNAGQHGRVDNLEFYAIRLDELVEAPPTLGGPEASAYSIYDWHEGSGSTTTSIITIPGDPSGAALTANTPATAWDGNASVGEFYGYPWWGGFGESSLVLSNWSTYQKISFPTGPKTTDTWFYKINYQNAGPKNFTVDTRSDGSVSVVVAGVVTAWSSPIFTSTSHVYNLAVTYSTANGWKLYIDGVVKFSGNDVITFGTGESSLINFGSVSGARITRYAAWRKELTSAEVNAL